MIKNKGERNVNSMTLKTGGNMRAYIFILFKK